MKDYCIVTRTSSGEFRKSWFKAENIDEPTLKLNYLASKDDEFKSWECIGIDDNDL